MVLRKAQALLRASSVRAAAGSMAGDRESWDVGTGAYPLALSR